MRASSTLNSSRGLVSIAQTWLGLGLGLGSGSVVRVRVRVQVRVRVRVARADGAKLESIQHQRRACQARAPEVSERLLH